MEHCDRFIDLISRSLDEALSPQDQQALDGHLRQCPQCRELAGQLTQIREELDSWEPQEAPEGFAQGVMDRVRGFEEQKTLIPLWKRPQVRALGSLAACLLLCVGVLRFDLGRSNASSASPASSQSSMSIAADGKSAAGSPALEESRAAIDGQAVSSESTASYAPDSDLYDSAPFSLDTPTQTSDANSSSAAVQYTVADPQSLYKSTSASLPDSGDLLQSVESSLGITLGTLLVVEEIPSELETQGNWHDMEEGYQLLVLDEAPGDDLYQALTQQADICLTAGEGPFVLLLCS